jgi:hypothetical protein
MARELNRAPLIAAVTLVYMLLCGTFCAPYMRMRSSESLRSFESLHCERVQRETDGCRVAGIDCQHCACSLRATATLQSTFVAKQTSGMSPMMHLLSRRGVHNNGCCPLAGQASYAQAPGASEANSNACSSLRAKIDELGMPAPGGQNPNLTYSVFASLVDELGFTEERIQSFGVKTVLIPSDQAFIDLFLDTGGDGVKPAEFVKLHSEVFKQVFRAQVLHA